MSDELTHLLHDSGKAGVYRLSLPISMLGTAAREAGYYFAEIDLADAYDKNSFLQALADALEFPDWFGHNWDALEDCLMDLSWLDAPGFVLVLTDADTIMDENPDDFAEAIEVFDEAAAYWHEGEHPLWVFVGCADPGEFELPLLDL